MSPNDAPAPAPHRRYVRGISSANGILALCWLTYAAYYFGRVNLAVALPVLGGDLGWSPTALGLLGSVFYWVYAAGQLVNGALGDRLSARRFVAIGLALSGALNVLFSTSRLLGIAPAPLGPQRMGPVHRLGPASQDPLTLVPPATAGAGSRLCSAPATWWATLPRGPWPAG